MLDYNQKQKVNVFSSPDCCRLEVVIAKDGRRRSLRLSLEETGLLIAKLQKRVQIFKTRKGE